MLRFEVFTAVPMKNTVFCDVTLCGCSKNRCFGELHRLHCQGDKNRRARNISIRLLVTANVVTSSPILMFLLMKAI
jgi:hypothetical protein